jgi:hypothetical protein
MSDVLRVALSYLFPLKINIIDNRCLTSINEMNIDAEQFPKFNKEAQHQNPYQFRPYSDNVMTEKKFRSYPAAVQCSGREYPYDTGTAASVTSRPESANHYCEQTIIRKCDKAV